MGLLRGVGGWCVRSRFERGETRRLLERALQLVEWRQLLEGPKVQVVEEFLRGCEDGGASGRLALAHDLDPAALDERVERGRRDGDAADVLDVAARHRLAVRNDGER